MAAWLSRQPIRLANVPVLIQLRAEFTPGFSGSGPPFPGLVACVFPPVRRTPTLPDRADDVVGESGPYVHTTGSQATGQCRKNSGQQSSHLKGSPSCLHALVPTMFRQCSPRPRALWSLRGPAQSSRPTTGLLSRLHRPPPAIQRIARAKSWRQARRLTEAKVPVPRRTSRAQSLTGNPSAACAIPRTGPARTGWSGSRFRTA